MASKKTLHITVCDKIATYKKRDGYIVCGNSGYTIQFTFDNEWDGYGKKTARFIWNGQHVDVSFEGNTCDVPLLERTNLLQVGVYVGDMSTTTSAEIECVPSVKCIESVAGSDSHTVAELNVAFGQTEPKDTSMLWVKTSKPSAIVVTPELQGFQFKEELSVKMEGCEYPEGIRWSYAAVGTSLYFFGGDLSTYSPTKTIHKLDLETGKLTTLGVTLPTARLLMSIAVVDSKIYLLGGAVNNNSAADTSLVYCFDPTTEAITQVGTLPQRVAGAQATAIGKKIYVIGGRRPTGAGGVYCYDTETNESTELAVTTPFCQWFSCGGQTGAAAIDSKVYFVADESNNMGIYCFDPSDLSVSKVCDCFSDSSTWIRTRFVLFAFGKKIYYLSGTNYSTYIYDTETGTKTTTSDNAAKAVGATDLYYPQCTSIGDVTYIFYGSSASSITADTINHTMLKFSGTAYGEGFKADQIHLHTTTEGELFTLVSTPQMNMSVAIEAVYKGTAEGIAETVPALLYKNDAWAEI